MSPARKKQAADPVLDSAQRAQDLARLEAGTARLHQVKAQYELLARRQDRPRPMVADGGNEDSVLPAYRRPLSIAEARELHENDLNIEALLGSMQTHVVGDCGGKAVFHTADKVWNAKAANLMKRWQRDCDFRIPGQHFNDWLKLALLSSLRDGDFALVFDVDLTEGKTLTFEADQVCEVEAKDWPAYAEKNGWTYDDPQDKKKKLPLIQRSGCLIDGHGRLVAIVTSSKRGLSAAPAASVTIYKIADARMVFRPQRLNQYRGNSVLLAMVTVINDFRQLIAAEIKSAKRIAQDALIVQRDNPSADILGAANLSADQLTEGTGQSIPAPSPARYEELEEAYGGGVGYIGINDKVTPVINNRPQPAIKDFELHTKQSCGLALGLYKMFSIGEVSTSYSAARAELLLTHATFRCMQKWLERQILDFVFGKLLSGWIRDRKLDTIPADPVTGEAPLPDETYTVDWPALPVLDPVAEVDAALKRLKGGLSNFDQELGADAEKSLLRLAENIKFLKENGLDILSIFETASGGASGSKSSPPPPDDEAEQNPQE